MDVPIVLEVTVVLVPKAGLDDSTRVERPVDRACRGEVCVGVEAGEAVVGGTDVARLSLLDVSTAVEEREAVVSTAEVLEMVAVEAVDGLAVDASAIPGGEEMVSHAVLRVKAEVDGGRDVAPVVEVDVSVIVVGVKTVSGGVLVT